MRDKKVILRLLKTNNTRNSATIAYKNTRGKYNYVLLLCSKIYWYATENGDIKTSIIEEQQNEK